MYSLLVHRKEEKAKDIRHPHWGDLVCFTVGHYKEKPLLVAFDVLVCLEDPSLVFDLYDPDIPKKKSFMEKVHLLLKKGELRYMKEIEKVELIFTQDVKEE